MMTKFRLVTNEIFSSKEKALSVGKKALDKGYAISITSCAVYFRLKIYEEIKDERITGICLSSEVFKK